MGGEYYAICILFPYSADEPAKPGMIFKKTFKILIKIFFKIYFFAPESM